MSVVINQEVIEITLETPPAYTITIESTPAIPVIVGVQGPQGATTVSNSVNKTAGEALGGNRVVLIDTDGKAYYADNTNLNHIHKVLGITKGAIENEAEGDIQTYGVMTETSWNWDMTKAIYLSTNGLLTQTVPTSGFVLQIGFPLSATSMFIDLKQPIVLI